MNVQAIAYKFILGNKIKNFSITLKDLINIVKNNGWEIFSFKQNLSLIKELNLEEKTQTTLGFTYTFKTLLNNKLSTKSIIFYKDELELNEKYFVILHEIGHIVLNHTYNNSTLDKTISLNNQSNLESEADLFACEVLAPSYILKKLNITNLTDIKKYTLIPEKYINPYLLEIHKINSHSKNSLTPKINTLYFKYTFNFKFVRTKTLSYFKYVTLILALIFITTVLLKPDKTTTNKNPTLTYVIENNIPVFVTKTGSKYHTEDCFHIKNSTTVTQISHEDLENSDYKPCKICFGNVAK